LRRHRPKVERLGRDDRRPPGEYGDELRALRRLQRESPPSPFVFVSDRGSPFTTAGFARARGRRRGPRTEGASAQTLPPGTFLGAFCLADSAFGSAPSCRRQPPRHVTILRLALVVGRSFGQGQAGVGEAPSTNAGRERSPKMKSAIPVIVFVLAGMVTLPQSAPAQPADVIVCSGSNLNCYYAPANIKLPATCFKGADTYGGRLVFRCDSRTTTTSPPDLGPAQKQLRAGPPVFGHDRGQPHRSRRGRRIERRAGRWCRTCDARR
jgi:hypothetical protein